VRAPAHKNVAIARSLPKEPKLGELKQWSNNGNRLIAVIDPVRHGFSLESLASPELTVLNQLKNCYT
jgi:hypothetical protein